MKIFGKDAPKSKPQRSTHGEQLAKALNWIITDDMFADVVLHGNIDWIVVHLVRVAILWVWSSQRELVVSANDAIEKTAELFGTSGINSYQTLVNALKIGPSYASERAHFLAMLETMKFPLVIGHKSFEHVWPQGRRLCRRLRGYRDAGFHARLCGLRVAPELACECNLPDVPPAT